MTIDEIRDNFELLEEWDDRYRYVIELGRMLDPMPEAEHSAENKVNGCVSQVWLSRQIDRSGNGPPDYPMVAPNYAVARSQLAKKMGLGQQARKRR